jgi:hypothetical protein
MTVKAPFLRDDDPPALIFKPYVTLLYAEFPPQTRHGNAVSAGRGNTGSGIKRIHPSRNGSVYGAEPVLNLKPEVGGHTQPDVWLDASFAQDACAVHRNFLVPPEFCARLRKTVREASDSRCCSRSN